MNLWRTDDRFLKYFSLDKPDDFIDRIEVFYLVRNTWTVVGDSLPGERFDGEDLEVLSLCLLKGDTCTALVKIVQY